MKDLMDLSLGESNLLLFKGRPTVGKTRALFGFPKPIRIYDLDDKIETLVKNYAGQFKAGEIFYDKFSPFEYEKFDAALEADLTSDKFKTYVVDSLTSLSIMILNYMIRLRGGTPDAALKGKKRGVVDFNTIEDYGGEDSALRDVIGFLKHKGDSSKYRILTAHTIPIETKTPDGKVISTQWELLTGGKKIAAKIPGMFKEIWHFTAQPGIIASQGVQYKVQTSNDGIDFANTMLPLPREIDWTGKNLFEVVAGLCKEKGLELPR